MLKTLFSVTLLIGLGWATAVANLTSDPWRYCEDNMRLEIADSRTWVSIAVVNLKITELELKEGRLRGHYDLRVPIRSSKNEAGMIDLTFPQQIADMRVHGGKMTWVGIRQDGTEEPREVTCEIIPDEKNLDQGDIVLKIDTGERVLTFKSTYAVIYEENASQS